MKPFNLERALAGDPVITRDGRKITEIAMFKAKELDEPVFAHIEGEKYTNSYNKDGKYYYDDDESPIDLFMGSIVKTGWVHAGAILGPIWDNPEQVPNYGTDRCDKVVQVTWEE